MIEIDDIKELCFAKFAKRLQKAMQPPNGDGDVVDLLLGWIVEMRGVSGRNKQPITLGTTSVSNLMNRRDNIHRSIKTAGGWPSTHAATEKHFRETVMPALNQNAVDDMLDGMRKDIEVDDKIASLKAKELVDLLDSGEDAKFLAQLFLYVLTRDNRDPAKAIKKPQKEKRESSVSLQAVSQTTPLPLLRSDTHFNIFTMRSLCSGTGTVSLIANIDWLTQNGDHAIKDAFLLHTEKMCTQIKNLPCLFSFYGDFDENGVPFDDFDFLPNPDATFAFGYIEDISVAKGQEDIRLIIRPRIEREFPQRKLINNRTCIYTHIGVRYPSAFYSERFMIVEGNLIEGLRKVGIEI